HIELLLFRLCQFNASPSEGDAKKKITIEPIAVPAAVAPKETAAVPKETPVAPKEETPAAPVAAVPKPEPSGLPKNSSLRFSLKKDASSVPETSVPEQETPPPAVLNEPFTQAALEAAWKNYAGKEDDVHLKNTILNSKPRLQEANRIHITVFNPDQESKLKERAGHIKQFLSQQLRNTQIELNITITEDKKDVPLYGGKEIFQFMAEKNPSMVTLAKEFSLVLR
ncbi:MAG: hypothetical protein LBB64_02550, partial [Dysgonamonadaceae bacterium]|nr:hypothetical protein [Dysgonamonadaceae bacterium]